MITITQENGEDKRSKEVLWSDLPIDVAFENPNPGTKYQIFIEAVERNVKSVSGSFGEVLTGMKLSLKISL